MPAAAIKYPTVDHFNLPEDLAKVANEELYEDESKRTDGIKILREWLIKQPHLNARTDDRSLLVFLRGSKFSFERAKQKLDSFYTLKTLLSEFSGNKDPLQPKLQEILKLGTCLPLPQSDQHGRLIILLRVARHDPANIKQADLFKISLMVLEVLMMKDPRLCVTGVTTILDLEGATLAHAAQLTPSLVKKFMTLAQDGYPTRSKNTHYINAPHGVETVLGLFKAVMKEKLRKRIFVHGGDASVIHEHIPKEVLPKEYGGSNYSVQDLTDYWKETVECYRDWFIEDEKYGCIESKRPGNTKPYENLFGTEGSFRQLNVD